MFKEALQGRFLKHPLHPMLVHFPIGLWLAAFIFDIIFLSTGKSALGIASYYAIGIGILGALIASVAGVAELLSIPSHTRTWKLAITHMALNLATVALFAVSFFLRRGLVEQGQVPVSTAAFVIAAVAVALLSVSGYIGGLLVYDHGVGFKPQNRDQRKAPLRRIA